ncbi:MAG: carboxylesterase family protein [Gammaproteobacteria bacterium]|nr:carboxylesterase family protein [Gammaproteobacteria bacterium]
MRTSVLALVVAGLALWSEAEPQPIGLTVAVTGGVVRGVIHPGDSDRPALRQYHGIPYAAPPVGERRWAPPAPVVSWDGVLDASAPGPVCIQRTRVGVAFYDPPEDAMLPPQSENCLTLNVWTEARHDGERRPVMVWIHGGALQAGSGSMQSGRLLAGHGAVVVTINYRLGRFGFLAHPELSASGVYGNQGYRDQIQALEWVRANIASFGGNPDNVTIFGESAGAYSVSVLQASPLARGLFHRAIGQSGGAFHPMAHRTTPRTYSPAAESVGLQFADALLAGQADRSVAAMRRTPAARILDVAESSPLFKTYEYLSTVDGEVLPDDVGTIFAANRQSDVPVLVGSTADEGSALLAHFTRFMGTGIAGFETFVRAMLPEAEGEITDVYPADTDNRATQAWANLFTDLTFTYPQRAWARSMGRLSSDAYLYWFTWAPPIPGRETYGSFHGAFQMYLFGDLHAFNAVPTDADRRMADVLARTWVRFARTGNPNGGELPAWPAHTRSNEAYLEFGETIRVGDDLRVRQLVLIEEAWAERRRTYSGL